MEWMDRHNGFCIQILWLQQIADPNVTDGARDRVRNQLGWLYAYYGRLDDARKQFQDVLASGEYAQAASGLQNQVEWAIEEDEDD